MPMSRYKCVFYVNGRRTEQIVAANNSIDARKLIEAQYSGCKVQFITVNLVQHTALTSSIYIKILNKRCYWLII